MRSHLIPNRSRREIVRSESRGRGEVKRILFPDFRTGTPTFQKLEWKGSYEPATAVSRSIKEYHRCAIAYLHFIDKL